MRLNAQLEKATARRIIKESMGCIEDERLELMELTVSSKWLESIAALDYDSLQSLESFQDCPMAFPSKSVKLEKPFWIQPWLDSDENIGNLLIVKLPSPIVLSRASPPSLFKALLSASVVQPRSSE